MACKKETRTKRYHDPTTSIDQTSREGIKMDLDHGTVKKLREEGAGHMANLALEGLCPTCAEPVDIDALADASLLYFYNAFNMCLGCTNEHKAEDNEELVMACEVEARLQFEDEFGEDMK